jgi:hypothetical protein
MSCPFYGKGYAALPGVLIETQGNQCALVVVAHAPCMMEVDMQLSPDWAKCPYNSQGGAKWQLAQRLFFGPMHVEGEQFRLHPSYEVIDSHPRTNGRAIKCLICGLTSHVDGDVQNLYCGNCHVFHEQAV